MSSVATCTPGQTGLIEALRDPSLYGVGCRDVRIIETHISYVILTGQHAFKIKKAVDLGFLDFTTLAARRLFCEQELRLNRRTAPSIYLDLVSITGTAGAPTIGGDGPVLEYAVKMREFPQDALLSRALARQALTPSDVDRLALSVAAFHTAAERALPASSFGTVCDVFQLARENFAEIMPLLDNSQDRADIESVRQWTEREYALRSPIFAARRRDGFVRECHGDLHTGNIALVHGEIIIFDCIEFSERMRWSDVLSDVAFLVMDLQERNRPDLAARFLNGYLESTGDYAGAQVLPFYLTYRAMVRAKVARLRADQTTDRVALRAQIAECAGYLRVARGYARSTRAGVLITHGPSGSGKTTRSQGLLELTGGIRIRTDVERKRRWGLPADARTDSELNSRLYTAEETAQTYHQARTLARSIVSGGYVAIVDGTFLRRRHRDMFRDLATELAVPFVIVDFVAAPETQRQRVAARHERGQDASEANVMVLEHQQQTAEPLASDEQPYTCAYNADSSLEQAWQIASWRPVLERLGIGTPV